MTEPTGKYSITMPRDIAEAARARGGPSGLSAYVAAAVARQIERDNLNELIQVAEAEHGPGSEEEVPALRDQLHQADSSRRAARLTPRDPLPRRPGRHPRPGQRRAGQGRPARPEGHRLAGAGPRRRPARDHVRGHSRRSGPPRINRPALEWTLSRLIVEPVTEPIARRAAALLADTGLHGHKYAIDAMLSATALAAPGPVTILTSGPEDLTALCGGRVTVIKI